MLHEAPRNKFNFESNNNHTMTFNIRESFPTSEPVSAKNQTEWEKLEAIKNRELRIRYGIMASETPIPRKISAGKELVKSRI